MVLGGAGVGQGFGLLAALFLPLARVRCAWKKWIGSGRWVGVGMGMGLSLDGLFGLWEGVMVEGKGKEKEKEIGMMQNAAGLHALTTHPS